uniref:histone deacetylase 6 n=1 Tax=Pristiophorus japonicus TaxID=55135 RepID=UPI00398F7FA9
MKATKDLKPRDLHRKSSEYNSIYIAPRSYDCALLAVGSVCNVVKAVLDRQVRNAVAIVRPPGHHADRDKACGFCLFNNVALAARFAQQQVGHKMRVLILDWDIHHGNGTQLIFEDDPSVLYISIHRYDNGTFFPNTHDGDYIKVGKGKGEGFNVNIAWNEGRMGDSEYMAAFQRVVMPIAYQYRPELVLVSAGFDSARGDPLGGCDVTPECFAHLTHMLQGLAGGRVVLVLEGGYNLSSISESMAMCTRTLLGDTPPSLEPLRVMINSAIDSINNVIKTHSQYWTCLRIHIPEQESQVQAIVTPMSAWPMQQAPEVALVDAIAKATSARRNSFWLPSQFTGVVNKGQDLLKHSLQPQDSPASIPEGRRVNTRSPLLQQQYLSVEEMVSGAEPARARVAGPRPGSRGGARPKVKMPTDSAAEAGPPRIASETDAERSETTQSEITFKRPEEDILRRGSSSDVSHSPSSTSRLQTDSDDDLRNVGSACHRSRCAEPDVPLPDLMLPADEPGTVYAVAPLLWCPHLEMVRPAADYDLDLDLPCEECGSVTENWLCLTCFQVHCGRYVNEHMVLHAMNYNHLVVLSFSDLSAWCYGCDSYIHNQVLSSAQEEVYRLKFGEESEEST